MSNSFWIINIHLLKKARKLTVRSFLAAMKILKSDGSVAWDENIQADLDPQQIPTYCEIGRTKLRDILLDAVKSDSIQWGKELVSFEKSEVQNKWDLLFTDGGVEFNFDVVVGADGEW
jgi:2-polyprenyl-6-methoxyphenol hydroxylase-like FAD-dependent oxidoreductase